MPVFYDEKTLKRNAANDQREPGLDFWPRGMHKPLMFLDIVGTENQSPYKDVSAADIFNMDEVNATVCLNIPVVVCLKFHLIDE